MYFSQNPDITTIYRKSCIVSLIKTLLFYFRFLHDKMRVQDENLDILLKTRYNDEKEFDRPFHLFDHPKAKALR